MFEDFYNSASFLLYVSKTLLMCYAQLFTSNLFCTVTIVATCYFSIDFSSFWHVFWVYICVCVSVHAHTYFYKKHTCS